MERSVGTVSSFGFVISTLPRSSDWKQLLCDGVNFYKGIKRFPVRHGEERGAARQYLPICHEKD